MQAALTQSSPSPFPSPRLLDDEDVRWALSTGGALWLRGEHHDALCWLRRAADRSSELDDDVRTMELLRSLDLCFRSLSAPRSTPPDGERPTLPPEPFPSLPPLPRVDSASPAGRSTPVPSAAPRPPPPGRPLPSPARPSAEPPRSAKIARPALPPPRGASVDVDEILEFEEAAPSHPPPPSGPPTARPGASPAAPSAGRDAGHAAGRLPSDPMRHATSVAVTRVAGKTEVVALAPGAPAPRGSVAALLVAQDGDDAAALRTLLGA